MTKLLDLKPYQKFLVDIHRAILWYQAVHMFVYNLVLLVPNICSVLIKMFYSRFNFKNPLGDHKNLVSFCANP